MEGLKQNVAEMARGFARPQYEVVVATDHIVYHEENLECEKSLFEMSHDEILNRVSPTHVLSHQHDSFDVQYFFSVTENIIRRSSQIVDNIAQDHPGVQTAAATDRTVKPNFNTPFCVLKSIVCEMPCNSSGEKSAHESTLRILKKLSTYPWEMKAVLALAAFASEYGEFSLLAQYQHSDQLANSLAILKGVPVNKNLKKWKAVSQLNLVIKQTLQVIDYVCQLVKLSRSSHDLMDVTETVTTAMKEIPVNVYWCIITIVACATNICLLKSDEGKSQDLVQYAHITQIISNKLIGYLTTCEEKIRELNYYREFIHTFWTCTETVEVIRTLIYFKDDAQHIFYGSAKTNEARYVEIDILKKKNVLLFFSTLDISYDDISALTRIHNHQLTQKENQYTILWIPVVEQWTDKLKKDFETLKNRMPWYTVERTNAPIAGIKFIKEEWKIIKGRATVVAMDTRRKILHSNALHMIRVWGIDAYPFTTTKEVELTVSLGNGWAYSVVEDIHHSISHWIKEEKYIFFYGGTEKIWIDQFTAKANAVKGKEILKKFKINIEIFHVERSEKGGDDSFSRFFYGVESMFSMIKVHKEVHAMTKQVQKLLSYKNESGWAVLMKGSTVVSMGHGSAIYKVLEHFDTLKEIPAGIKFDFSIHFQELLKKEVINHHACACVEVPFVAGSVQEIMSCHECPRSMHTYISYKCCHDDNMATNYYC